MASNIKDMTQGRPARLIFAFALPLMVGNVFQQLYIVVDTAVVGRFVGVEALASVGAADWPNWMVLGMVTGFAQGFCILISQRFGAGDMAGMRRNVSHTYALGLALAAVLTLAAHLAARPILTLLGTPDNVMGGAMTYLRISYSGIFVIMAYNVFSSVLRALGDSKSPLYAMIIAAAINVVLDLLFVAVFHWGIAGAAIATVAAQVLSAGLVLGVLTRSRGCYRIQWRGMRMHRGILRNIFVVGVPSALQLAITSFSNVFVQSYVNRFASSCMAGWAAYQKIDAFVILPMTTLSVTATTFVGQNVGAGNWDRAKQGIRCALAMATVVTGVLLVPLMVFAQPLCTLFNQEPEVLGYGVYFIRLISPFYLVANFNQIYAGALRGAGDAKVPMVIMLGSFVVFRQLYLFVTYQVAGTLLPVALGYPVGWVVCSGVLLWYYRSGRWMAHSLVTPAGRGTDRERE